MTSTLTTTEETVVVRMLDDEALTSKTAVDDEALTSKTAVEVEFAGGEYC
jgi:hypothetical protein